MSMETNPTVEPELAESESAPAIAGSIQPTLRTVQFFSRDRRVIGVVTIQTNPSSVGVQVFDAVEVTPNPDGPGEYLARCNCFGVQGRGPTRESARLDLRTRLQAFLTKALRDGQLDKRLELTGRAADQSLNALLTTLQGDMTDREQLVQLEAAVAR